MESSTTESFSDLLQMRMEQRGLRLKRLARASGVPVSTVHRWIHGAAENPYHWEHLLRVAAALGLPRAQANQLLRAAGVPALDQLEQSIRPGDDRHTLFAPWQVAVRQNLPAPLTPLIGRDHEITELAMLLADGATRLLTLTGIGGSGKTRLALRVAAELLDAFPDGVFVVECAPIADEQLVLPAIVAALGIRESREQSPLDHLRDYLRQRRVLLVLDNLEHLLDAGPDLARLLASAPRLAMLVTSRVPLALLGEQQWLVQPLAIPARDAPFDIIRRASAVELFETRARAVKPRFAVDRENAADVAAVCRWLDGLPLAIELAASRVGDHPPAALLSTFARRLDLGADGPRNAPDRQRALRSTIAWSEQLLGEPAQALFAELAVFAGGWTVDAAAAVHGASIDNPMHELVAANLATREEVHGTPPRFRMLDTIREHALERLIERGGEAVARRRHFDYYQAFAERAPVYQPLARNGDWWNRADGEVDNFRQAIRWALDEAELSDAARLAVALWPFWQESGHRAEGLAVIHALLPQAAGLSVELQARLHAGALVLSLGQSHLADALAHADAAIACAEQIGDDYLIGLIRNQQAWALHLLGYHARAVEAARACLAHSEAAGDQGAVARDLADLSLFLTVGGEFAEAEPLARRAHGLVSMQNDQVGLARSEIDRGLGAMLQRDVATAIELLSSGIDRLAAYPDSDLLAGAQLYLGASLCFSGRLDEAAELLRVALRRRLDNGDRYSVAIAVLAFAAIARRRGGVALAVRLAGGALALQAASNAVLAPALRAMYEQEIAAAQAALGAQAFLAVFNEGQQLTRDELVTLTLAV